MFGRRGGFEVGRRPGGRVASVAWLAGGCSMASKVID